MRSDLLRTFPHLSASVRRISCTESHRVRWGSSRLVHENLGHTMDEANRFKASKEKKTRLQTPESWNILEPNWSLQVSSSQTIRHRPYRYLLAKCAKLRHLLWTFTPILGNTPGIAHSHLQIRNLPGSLTLLERYLKILSTVRIARQCCGKKNISHWTGKNHQNQDDWRWQTNHRAFTGLWCPL